MATLTIQNVTATDLYLSDLYATIAAGATATITRAASDLPRMASLQAAVAASQVVVSVTYSASETASGLLQGAQTVQAVDVQPVAANLTFGLDATLRVVLTAGGGGSPDDVTAFALNAVPIPKFRVVSARAYISAGAAGGRTLTVRTASAGGGTALTVVPATATGPQSVDTSITATVLVTAGSSVGLFIRRSDSAIAGEIFLTIRPET